MSDERILYTERTPWAGLVKAILWTAVVVVCYPLLAGWDHDLPMRLRWPIAGAVVGVAALLTYAVGGLTVRVRESSLLIHLGAVPIFRTTIPFRDIRATEPVAYRPLLEFGGWGMRGRGSRRAWTARGDRAVKLVLTDGREVLIGSDHPQRLEERIRTAAGPRIRGEAT
jgi:hypothetical protein